MLFSSAVVGLGRIGQGYDYDSNNPKLIMTHALGFLRHPAYTLAAGVDPDPILRKKFEEKYGCPAFSSVKELYTEMCPEVLSIGVPTQLHFDVFSDVFGAAGKNTPKAILCEKPIATRVSEAEKMVSLAQEKKCALLVNYMRRFDPGVRELRKRFQNQKLGELYKGLLWYSKGILNNGSHIIDLLRFLIGEVTETEVIRPGRSWNDIDPEPDVRIRFKNVDIYFLSAKEECFSICDLQLIGTKGSVKYLNGGVKIEIFQTYDDPLIPGQGYEVLQEKPEVIPDELYQYQWNVLEALKAHLRDGSEIASDGKSALGTLRVVDEILRKREKMV